MQPRYAADYRTLFWALLLFPLVPVIGLTEPSALWALLPVALYTSFCAGVITHNHTHAPVFHAAWANDAFSAWLSIFYGCPIAFWIPTHLEDHHRHLDGPDDVTCTRRRSPDNHLWQALVYTFACASWQRPLIVRYVRAAHDRRGRRWRALCQQTTALVSAHGAALGLALWLHGPGRGLLAYALAFGLPAAFSTSWMQLINYFQHVHCDPSSPDNHSRNFVSRSVNWFVFEAGYHTVHHERPSVHWSLYPELHRQRAARIHPSLIESTVLTFCLRAYVAGALSRRYRTRPLAPPAPGAAQQA